MPETVVDALGTEDAKVTAPSERETWHDLSDDELENRLNNLSHC